MMMQCVHCKEEIEVNDDWSGLTGECPYCKKAIKIPGQKKPGASANLVVGFGWFLLLSGLACAAYFLMFYDTSVAVPSVGAVNNMGLMQNRTLGCVVGIGAAIIGALMVLLGRQRV